MSQPVGQQIQVDPSALINQMQVISSQVIGQMMHDLALAQTALFNAQGEVERLTRVNHELRSREVLGKPQQPKDSGDSE